MTAGMVCCVVILLITVSLSAQHDLTRSKGEVLDNGEHVHTKRGSPTYDEICEGVTDTIKCPDRTQISIISADYGLRVPVSISSKCAPGPTSLSVHHLPKETCLTSAAAALRALCNGQNRCRFTAENSLFPNDPCVGYSKRLMFFFGCQRMPAGPVKAYACGHFRLDLECPAGQTITMVSANWGRKSHDSCNPRMLNRDMTHFREELGCSMDVLNTMAARCNGKNWCSTMAEDQSFGADPCYRIYKQLEVMYNCN